MFTEYRQLRAEIRRLAATATGTIALLGGLAAVPKDMGFAASSRFALMLGFGLVTVVGTGLTMRAWRRLTEARLALRHAGAGPAIAVTLRFLLDERRLARRFLLPAFLLMLGALFLVLASHWPQAALLAGWRPTFIAVAVLSSLVLVVAPFVQRTHWINANHLRSLVRQQMRLAQFKPVTVRRARQRLKALTGPAVVRTGSQPLAGGVAWEWSDFTKGVLVLGQPGSGKTATVLNALLELIFQMFPGRAGFGTLIQDVKGDFRGKLERLAARFDRSDTLVTFDLLADPATAGAWDAAIFNPIDSDDPPAEVAASLQATTRHLGGATQDSFFSDAFRTLNIHGIVLLRAALPEGEVASIAGLNQLYLELHQAAEQTARGAEEWPTPFYNSLGARVRDLWPVPEIVPQDIGLAISYFETEFRTMASRQRSALIGTVSQLFAELLADPICRFITGPSTVSMADVIEQGLIYYVNAPLARYPRGGLIVNTIIKRQFQLAVRRAREKEIPSLYLCDEFHNLFSPGADGDSQFFSLSRDANHANVIAVQNLPLLGQVAKSKTQIMALLGNIATKIMLRNTEPETNEYASTLFGEGVGIGVSQSEVADMSGLFRRRRTSYSRSSTKGRIVPPDSFTRLAVPVTGDPERQYSQSIVHLATRAETERLDLVWKVHPL